MTTYDVGEIIGYKGHDWRVDKVNSGWLEVTALTKKRYNDKEPDGFVGWNAFFYTHVDGHIL